MFTGIVINDHFVSLLYLEVNLYGICQYAVSKLEMEGNRNAKVGIDRKVGTNRNIWIKKRAKTGQKLLTFCAGLPHRYWVWMNCFVCYLVGVHFSVFQTRLSQLISNEIKIQFNTAHNIPLDVTLSTVRMHIAEGNSKLSTIIKDEKN